jgi:hypothetical protein
MHPEEEEQEKPLRALSSKDAQQFDSIIHSIADLDNQYEAGDLDEKTYRRQRKKLQNKAIRLRISEARDE